MRCSSPATGARKNGKLGGWRNPSLSDDDFERRLRARGLFFGERSRQRSRKRGRNALSWIARRALGVGRHGALPGARHASKILQLVFVSACSDLGNRDNSGVGNASRTTDGAQLARPIFRSCYYIARLAIKQLRIARILR